MTQNEKDLLLKDLSTRLQYGVKVHISTWNEDTMEYEDKADEVYSINKDGYIRTVNEDYEFEIEDVKPYLLPLSGMSDYQIEEMRDLCDMYDPINDYDAYEDWGTRLITKHFMDDEYQFKFNFRLFEFLNKNRLDYCGLIKKELAIDATGLDIY